MAGPQRICTRSVNELVKALCMGRISKSQVSRLCAEIDERVSAFLGRPIEGDWPYLWIMKVREAGRIVSVAAIVAVGVNTNGRREVLGPSRRGSPTVGRRNPMRWFRRAGVRSPRAAPYKPSTTSAIRRSATKPIITQEIGSGATLQEILKPDPVHGASYTRPGTPALEIVENRHGRASTLLTSQLPVSRWHDVVGEPALADAILDRIVHHAQRIELKGNSLRKRQRAPS